MLSYAIFQGTHCYFEQLAPPFTGRRAIAAMTKEIVPGFFNYAGFPYNRDWYLAEVVDFRNIKIYYKMYSAPEIMNYYTQSNQVQQAFGDGNFETSRLA